MSTADKEAIEEARKAYDDLTEEQKAKVSEGTLKKLTDAEKALEEAEQQEEKDASDQKAADEVTKKINALPEADGVTTADKEAIEEARKAYNDLTEEEKAIVSEEMLKKLTDAEKALEKTETDTPESRKGMAEDDLTDAQKVVAGDLDYTGKAMALVSAPQELPEGYDKVQYSVTGGEGTWTDDIPFATEEGAYWIKVKYVGDETHESFETAEIIVRIGGSDDDEMTPEERHNLEYAKQHPHGQHTWIQKIVKDPTGEVDGIMINVCQYCGFVEHDSEQEISAYGVFNAKTVTAIQNSPEVGAAEMETKRWISVHRKVLEALVQKPGVTLEIHYLYEGKHCVLRISGNDPLLAELLQMEDMYFGFRYLGTMFETIEE